MAYSPAPLVLDRSKPAPWNVEAAFVAPEYRGLWRGLRFLVANWEGSSTPTDLVDRVVGVTQTSGSSAPTWEATERGVARRYNRSGSSTDGGTDKFTVHEALDNVGTGAVSSCVVFIHSGDQDNLNTYLAKASAGGSAAGWKLHVNSFDTDNHRFRVEYGDGSSGSVLETADNVIVNGQVHVAVWTRGSGVSRLYIDGVQHDSESSSLDLSNTRHITVGAMDNSSSPGFAWGANGSVLLAGMWDRELHPSEIRLLSFAPSGLLRPNWDYVTASAFDPANFQASVVDDDVTLTWDASF